MRGPKPPTITLTSDERQHLEQLTRRHRTPQHLALRARIVLAAAEGFNNAQIARQHAVTVDTARHWRSRWLLCCQPPVTPAQPSRTAAAWWLPPPA